jgi:hypothetical protein|tara:strand:- start:824 stop:1024 length:201 start_codon:yes stop_codon:yes gene_type:complete
MLGTIRVSKKDFFDFKLKHERLLYSDKIFIKLHTIEEDGTYVISFGEGISEDAYELYDKFVTEKRE